MAIASNPFGVGESGNDLVRQTPVYDCCQLRFAYDTPRLTPKSRQRCDHCVDHRPDGSLTDQRDALGEHEPRLRERLRLVTDKANELERRNTRQSDEIADQRRQAAAALQARDRHRALAAAALSVHGRAPGGGHRCLCGQPDPCKTTRAVNAVDDRAIRDLRHFPRDLDVDPDGP
jgi:hypothetical protein